MNNTEEIFDTILPIGSIVLTENGEVPLMIVGRASLFEQDGETGYFDYSAVTYPQGVTDGKEFIFFNRENVSSIIYFGYVNAEEQEFASKYDSLGFCCKVFQKIYFIVKLRKKTERTE